MSSPFFFSLPLTLVICFSLLTVATSHTWIHCTKYQAQSNQDFAVYNDAICAGYPRGWTAASNLPFGATSQDFVHTYPLFSTNYPFQPQYFNYPGRPGQLQACFKPPTYNGRYRPATYVPGEKVCLAYPSENHVPNRGCTYNPFTDLGQRLYYQPAGQDPSISEVSSLPSIELPPYSSNCPNYCDNTQQSLCTACFTVPALSAGRYTFVWEWKAIRLQSNFNPNVLPQTPITYYSCWEVEVKRAHGGGGGGGGGGGFQLPPARGIPFPYTDYFLSPVHAPDQCMDVSDLTAGAFIVVKACNGEDRQKWTLQTMYETNYFLVNRQTGKVVDTPISTEVNLRATLGDLSGGVNQQFTLGDQGDGKYSLMAVQTQGNQVLDVAYAGRDGAQVVVYPNNRAANQMWRFHQA